jgi:hypothetical protein
MLNALSSENASDEGRRLRLDAKLVSYINLKLTGLGCPTVPHEMDPEFTEMLGTLLRRSQETDRLLSNYLCPADNRIQTFLYDYLQDAVAVPKLPTRTFALDRPGLARALSLPPGSDDFSSDIIQSYRIKQGVLHNPKSDRRTTKGIFHVTEGGLPIPDDKKAVPKVVFGNLLRVALSPPPELLRLPFTSAQNDQAECFVSLLLRPLVCPEVPGHAPEKAMEVRFFAPGSLVSNLDFVESIFGNGGDPYLPQNDAALDTEHWTGHTGCVILATHLITLTKKAAGLPAFKDANERQRRDAMCWKDEGELYNDGEPFKVTARDASGVIVTIIADNYFGYCKKEVKTQLSFAANLFGSCEEEHAGGAYVYPSYDLGEEFSGGLHVRNRGHSFDEVVKRYGAAMDVKPEGYAIDKRYPEIIYVPETVHFDLHSQKVFWQGKDGARSLKLLPDKIYVRPSGYQVRMEKPPGWNRAWRLIGTVAEPTLCHKPCTVSGGGKSEISKAITDAVLTGPVFMADFQKDFDQVAELVARDYSERFKDKRRVDRRPILSAERSLGSVIKLLTPAMREYRPEYNDWLETIPQHIKELVFVVKRYYKSEWGKDWRSHFSVDIINGTPGNELKCDNRKLVTTYVRVGYEADGLWRTFGLRKDFHPAAKIQAEDDITASVVVPAGSVPHLPAEFDRRSVKLVKNCEQRLFQRPDDAIHRGYDKQTESDFSRPGNFLSNYEPLTPKNARDIVEDALNFDCYTLPMQAFIREVAQTCGPTYFVSTAHPRLVNGKPTKNPRYLQPRPDLLNERDVYLAQMATRLARRMPLDAPVLNPVAAVLPGRRNNPPDTVAGIRPLAVYNPIHYMELPELFMEFICSMTGKSPSTTGAGSEGAMTKGPFNALPPIIDLNAALVSFLVTGHEGFVTAAGYVGPHVRVDHDISMLIPEIWCRMTADERDPANLIKEACLEKCQDFEFNGHKILASRLGHRITAKFVRTYFGRMFNHPHQVLTEMMLKPEMQDMAVFADGVDNIVTTQKRVAAHYFNDGSIEWACPPLRALLHIMMNGHWEGKDLNAPEVRSLFTSQHLFESDWYRERLQARQAGDVQLWQRHVAYLDKFLARPNYSEEAERLDIRTRLEKARAQLAAVKSPKYLERLNGTIGAEPRLRPSNL